MWKNQFLKVKNIILELEKDFMELKDRELKDGEEAILKIEIEELFYKLIVVFKDDMDKFKEQEMKKIRPIKKTCYDLLIKQTMVGKKKPKIIRDILKDKIIRDTWTLLETEEEKEERKKEALWKNN